MLKYLTWIFSCSLACGIYGFIQIDIRAGITAFALCFSLSLLPLIGCSPRKQDADNKYNNNKQHQQKLKTNMATMIKSVNTITAKVKCHVSRSGF